MKPDKKKEYVRSAEIFIEHFKKFRNSPMYFGSLQYFLETGSVTGSLLSSVHDMMEEYSRIKTAELNAVLEPFKTLALEVLYNSNIKGSQTVYAYNKAEITFDDLKAVAKALCREYTEPVGK